MSVLASQLIKKHVPFAVEGVKRQNVPPLSFPGNLYSRSRQKVCNCILWIETEICREWKVKMGSKFSAKAFVKANLVLWSRLHPLDWHQQTDPPLSFKSLFIILFLRL